MLSSKQAREYVSAKRLTSAMNNTRWQALFQSLNASHRMFQYRRKDLDGSWFPEDGISFTPEIAQYWGEFSSMEWFDILAYKEIRKGALLPIEVVDYSDELIEIARSVGAKFSIIDHGIRVWGYIRENEQPNLQ
ncbi:hypothetical protein OPU71_20910 [Niveibacterium sp. 24ML]|uniref:DUF6678 family protein n=1 Tax=Niveibacterium sp. 24ML TaxID=2985512 RepID=UPI002270AAA4|nr:DUF6678 family protein [Niveibacterium sp. 24ML]MCX9158581.1 hypothetical protein [Niveibacterium sp. 24ML]